MKIFNTHRSRSPENHSPHKLIRKNSNYQFNYAVYQYYSATILINKATLLSKLGHQQA